MKFVTALICLLLACFMGDVFVYWGKDTRGGWPISPAVIYLGIVVWASPFWLFTFVPPFLLASSGSIFWKWYVAPFAGILIGFLSSLMVFGKMGDTADGNFSQIFLAPFAIGFSLFLFGSIAKKLIAEGADA